MATYQWVASPSIMPAFAITAALATYDSIGNQLLTARRF
jgi:hypothetical protein